MNYRKHNAFTLLELLVVIAIISLLMAIMLPALSHARKVARVTQAHAELRAITLSIEIYRDENKRQVPPTRFSCSTRSAYELPLELYDYLPVAREDGLDYISMPDPFTPEACYYYRAVGMGILNESTYIPDSSTLWVPDGCPGDQLETGKYYKSPKESPVLYAVWSMGPDPNSGMFDIPGRLPLPQKYWLKNASGDGVITHFQDREERFHASP